MAIEQFANRVSTTLSTGINNVTTTIPITAATGFPSSAQYRIVIDNEILTVTAGAGTTSWTATRGVEGSAAVSHSAGATVRHVLTAGALINYVGSPIAPTVADGVLSADDAASTFNVALLLDKNVDPAAAIAESKLALASDAAAGTASRRTLGLTGNKAMPGTTTLDQIAAPTSSVNFNSQRITSQADPTAAQDGATKNYIDLRVMPAYLPGVHNYASVDPAAAAVSSAVPNANDARWVRVAMAETGRLRDVSCLVQTTGGNAKVIIQDTGQANATHTTRTVLAISGSIAVPALNGWITYDPNLAVNAGDTLEFLVTLDGTVAKIVAATGGAAGTGALPNSNFLTSSGAGTSSAKLMGTLLAASVPTTVGNTVTDANMVTAGVKVLFVWRIS